MNYPTLREFLAVLERYGSYLAKKIDEGKMFKVYEEITIPAGGSYSFLVDNSSNQTDVVIGRMVYADSDRPLGIQFIVGMNVTFLFQASSLHGGKEVRRTRRILVAKRWTVGILVLVVAGRVLAVKMSF